MKNKNLLSTVVTLPMRYIRNEQIVVMDLHNSIKENILCYFPILTLKFSFSISQNCPLTIHSNNSSCCFDVALLFLLDKISQ